MTLTNEFITRILAAFVAGGLLGIEREFKSKPAGFRTMILICVGSCLFSIISQNVVGGSDRIASNILTGVGFIGAGVVFKEGIQIKGITSAATIWMAAAIGMALGFGFYEIAALVWLLVITTLLLMIKLEHYIDSVKQTKQYDVSFAINSTYVYHQFEKELIENKIKFQRIKIAKQTNAIKVSYSIEGSAEKYNLINELLLKNGSVVAFEV